MAFALDAPTVGALLLGFALSVMTIWFLNRPAGDEAPRTVLDGQTWYDFPLKQKIDINHNTAMCVSSALQAVSLARAWPRADLTEPYTPTATATRSPRQRTRSASRSASTSRSRPTFPRLARHSPGLTPQPRPTRTKATLTCSSSRTSRATSHASSARARLATRSRSRAPRASLSTRTASPST